MLRILLLMITLIGLLSAENQVELKKDIAWLMKMEKKYDGYISEPKEVYLKELQVDSTQFDGLVKEYHADSLPNNDALKKQFQKTSFKMKKFVKFLNSKVDELKRQYKDAYGQAVNMIKRAKNEKNPNLLVGSKQQYMIAKNIYEKQIKKVISNPNILANIQKDLDYYQKRYDEISFEVKKEQLSKTKKPKEKYQGKDRAKYKEMIASAWREKYPKDEVLDIIFHMKGFRHTKTKKWNSATKDWRYRDTEVLAVTVAVKSSEKIVTLYMAYINKDNLSGKLSTGVETKGSEYVIREMLAKNY